ncbi:MAG: ornithine carbamoyltransferase [Patescibacteria group bacterium]
MKHLLSLKDYSVDDIKKIIDRAIIIKKNPGKYAEILKNKTMVMLFQKTSTRTRLSFEAGMTQLGGHGIFLDSRTSQLAIADFKDEARAIMRFCDILMFRSKKFSDVEIAASLNAVPVIDACSEKYHPCQTLGDILTMAEHSGGIENIKKITWLGIKNNVSNTLKLACSKLGIEVFMVTPEIHEPSIDKELNRIADETGKVHKTLDLKEALDNTDYIHTDTWLDMEYFDETGTVKPEFKKEYEERVAKFKPYQINAALLDEHCPKARIMHCMPCHVGYEITRDAIDHKNSVIFDQAENRLHAQKAAILYLLGKL